MDIIQHYFTEQGVSDLLAQFRGFGMFFAFFLPFIEAFLPFLPIIVFAVVNVNAYGIVIGFLLTWSGAVTGAYLVFIIVRRYAMTRWFNHLYDHPYVRRFIGRVHRQGIIPLAVLLAFPFTPSSIINIVAALAGIRQRDYLIAVMTGKALMLLLLSYIGADIYSFVRQPEKSIIVITILVLLWWGGKKAEQYYHERVDEHS